MVLFGELAFPNMWIWFFIGFEIHGVPGTPVDANKWLYQVQVALQVWKSQLTQCILQLEGLRCPLDVIGRGFLVTFGRWSEDQGGSLRRPPIGISSFSSLPKPHNTSRYDLKGLSITSKRSLRPHNHYLQWFRIRSPVETKKPLYFVLKQDIYIPWQL